MAGNLLVGHNNVLRRPKLSDTSLGMEQLKTLHGFGRFVAEDVKLQLASML